MRRSLFLPVLFLMGCAYQTPYVIGPPDISPPPVVYKQSPVVVEETPPSTGEKQPLVVVEKTLPSISVEKAPPIEKVPTLPLTVLYGDPSRGYVHNLTENKFIRGWWTLSQAEKRPKQMPDFELAPGFVREFQLPPGKNWLYVEGIYFTQRGEKIIENSAGWNTFQVEVTSRLLYDGYYGWRVVIYEGYFRY